MIIPVALASASLIALYLLRHLLSRKRRDGEPPLVPGHLVWGNGAAFAEDAVKFLLDCKKKYGSVFTIRLLNCHMTILMDHRDFDLLGREKNFDFDQIQKQVNWNVFHFVLKEPRKMMKETGRWVKGRPLIKSLSKFISNLSTAYNKLDTVDQSIELEVQHKLEASVVDGQDWTQIGLRVFASKTIFASIFNTIFGCSDDKPFDSTKAYRNFDIFHKYFNYFWLGLPKMFFPEALTALEKLLTFPEAEDLLEREDLSEYVRNAIYYMRQSGQTESDIKGHNLVFLHVNYNVFRVSFWILYYLLVNKVAMDGLKAEMKEVFEERHDQETNSVVMTIKEVENMEVLGSVVNESFRKSSGVFMVRHVTKDTEFQSSDGNSHLIRKGDKVAIYPPAIHKNPELFGEPSTFKYDRFLRQSQDYDKFQAVMPFGSLCPGKRYAILQSKIFVLSVLSNFDLELLPGEVTECDVRYHGHEILPPVKDVNINYRQLKGVPNLSIVE